MTPKHTAETDTRRPGEPAAESNASPSIVDTDTFRIEVRGGQCAGSGGCRTAAPRLFDLGNGGFVRVLNTRPALTELDDALEAHDACPLGVIDVLDTGGNSLA